LRTKCIYVGLGCYEHAFSAAETHEDSQFDFVGLEAFLFLSNRPYNLEPKGCKSDWFRPLISDTKVSVDYTTTEERNDSQDVKEASSTVRISEYLAQFSH
jgi:hypothetical protein